MKRKQESSSSDVQAKKVKTTGLSKSGDHKDNAGRFMEMCATLDRIKGTYTRIVPKKQSALRYPHVVTGEPYLITHLKFWVAEAKVNQTFLTRTGTTHSVAKCGNDGRKGLPSTINDAIGNLVDSTTGYGNATWGSDKQRASIPWIVCYLNNIHPDTNQDKWKSFDCSHRCIGYGLPEDHYCINPGCLVWESKSYNQERGNRFCCNLCAHGDCGKTICSCNKLHEPSCL